MPPVDRRRIARTRSVEDLQDKLQLLELKRQSLRDVAKIGADFANTKLFPVQAASPSNTYMSLSCQTPMVSKDVVVAAYGMNVTIEQDDDARDDVESDVRPAAQAFSISNGTSRYDCFDLEHLNKSEPEFAGGEESDMDFFLALNREFDCSIEEIMRDVREM